MQKKMRMKRKCYRGAIKNYAGCLGPKLEGYPLPKAYGSSSKPSICIALDPHNIRGRKRDCLAPRSVDFPPLPPTPHQFCVPLSADVASACRYQCCRGYLSHNPPWCIIVTPHGKIKCISNWLSNKNLLVQAFVIHKEIKSELAFFRKVLKLQLPEWHAAFSADLQEGIEITSMKNLIQFLLISIKIEEVKLASNCDRVSRSGQGDQSGAILG